MDLKPVPRDTSPATKPLFAERFAVRPVGTGGIQAFTYDAARSINCLADGSTAVVCTHATETETFTKVSAEPSDRDVDRLALAGTRTTTEVSTERPDDDRDDLALATETRVAGEHQDVSPDEVFWHTML